MSFNDMKSYSKAKEKPALSKKWIIIQNHADSDNSDLSD